MDHVTFSPRLRPGGDTLERWLIGAAQIVLLTLLVILPILFIPHAQLSLGFTKSFEALAAVSSAFVLFGLFMLRMGFVRLVGWSTLSLWWLWVFIGVASALLSGDRRDAFLGDVFGSGTVGFMALLALIITVTALVIEQRARLLRGLMALAVVSFLFQLWHVLRIVAGPEWLSFGVFTAPTLSPLGSFNDVAIFSGLLIIVSLIALLQLPLRASAQVFFGLLTALSLFLLLVINFFAVWVTVGFFALLVLLYALTRDRLLAPVSTPAIPAAAARSVSWPVVAIVGLVCVTAATGVLGGSAVGSSLGLAFGVQYVEVRPSFTSTLDIASAAYRDDQALLGVGPARFEDAWRQYRDPVINTTLFWNTTFGSGSGYIPTMLVTLGVAGVLAMLLALGSLVLTGYRTLVTAAAQADAFWYFIATTASASAFYLWGVAFIYVPGVSLLLLAAFMSGLLLVAYGQLQPQSARVYTFTDSRPRAFILIGIVMAMVTGAMAVLFVVSTQFVAHVTFANALRAATTNPDPVAADAALADADALFPSDSYIAQRVQLRLGLIGDLLRTENPTEADVSRFNQAAAEALSYASEAVRRDPTNPTTHLLLGTVHGVLFLNGATTTEGALMAAFAKASELDPQNPEYALIEAQIAARVGNLARTRTLLQMALTRKSNYVDALYLLTQLDVSEGNTEAALSSARSLVSIEPQNPVRYFQLGSLLLSRRDTAAARGAFEAALALDPQFANARYLLALVYIEEGRTAEALAALRTVQSTNMENAELNELIAALESGTSTIPTLGVTPPVSESTPAVDGEGVTTSPAPSDTDLIVPVNRSSTPDEEIDSTDDPLPSEATSDETPD